jgi:hypothetical protein
VAPHEENEDSQSYYSENSEEESAYQLQYVEFLQLLGEIQAASTRAKQPQD